MKNGLKYKQLALLLSTKLLTLQVCIKPKKTFGWHLPLTQVWDAGRGLSSSHRVGETPNFIFLVFYFFKPLGQMALASYTSMGCWVRSQFQVI